MSARLSAFAALNNSDSESDNEPKSTAVIDENGDDRSNGDGERADSVSSRRSQFENANYMSIDLGLGGSSVYVSGTFNNQFVPVLNSNFALEKGGNVVYHEQEQIIGLKQDDVLVVKGQYVLRVVSGKAVIDSYVVGEDSNARTVNASNLTSIPCIRAVSASAGRLHPGLTGSFSCVVALSNHTDGMENLPSLYPHLKYLYASENSKNSYSHNSHNYTFSVLLEAESNRLATSIPDSWEFQLGRLTSFFANSDRKNKVILIIGNKNTGKSTFLKLLANSLLSETSTAKSIQVLDMDPGQPELCLPGCISLSTITSPLLGTVQSFQIEKSSEIVKYLGFNSPNVQPLNYLRQLDELLEKINSSKDTITLINSPGWVKGFGAEIIAHLNANLDITSLIQLSDELRDLDIIREIHWEKETEVIRLPSASRSTHSFNSYPPIVIRNFKLLSYMHYDLKSQKFDFTPLLLKSPYRLSYLSLTSDVHKLQNFPGITGVSIFDSQGVSVADVPQCLECQYVALVTISKEDLLGIEARDTKPSSSLPNYINENLVHSIRTNFHGLAIVHSVDNKYKTINLYTPIDTHALLQTLVSNKEKLILVKGREEVPMDEIYSTQLIKGPAMFWNNFGISCLPYVSESLSNEVTGGKTVGIRRNIQRR